MTQFLRPCLDCGALYKGDRCPTHAEIRKRQIEQRRKPNRSHYKGDYAKRAKQVRDAATHCWVCGEEAREGDPFQADHVVPGHRDSQLLAAHRSCNIKRHRHAQASE